LDACLQEPERQTTSRLVWKVSRRIAGQLKRVLTLQDLLIHLESFKAQIQGARSLILSIPSERALRAGGVSSGDERDHHFTLTLENPLQLASLLFKVLPQIAPGAPPQVQYEFSSVKLSYIVQAICRVKDVVDAVDVPKISSTLLQEAFWSCNILLRRTTPFADLHGSTKSHLHRMIHLAHECIQDPVLSDGVMRDELLAGLRDTLTELEVSEAASRGMPRSLHEALCTMNQNKISLSETLRGNSVCMGFDRSYSSSALVPLRVRYPAHRTLDRTRRNKKGLPTYVKTTSGGARMPWSSMITGIRGGHVRRHVWKHALRSRHPRPGWCLRIVESGFSIFSKLVPLPCEHGQR
jgi:hypothetical protein